MPQLIFRRVATKNRCKGYIILTFKENANYHKGGILLRDYEQLKNYLIEANQIISRFPQVKNMNEDELFEFLGTEDDMVGIRWMVWAKIICLSMENCTDDKKIDLLKALDNKTLTSEYVGFLFALEYNVNLIRLLLKAEDKGCFIQMFNYIKNNFKHIEQYNWDEAKKLIICLGKNKDIIPSYKWKNDFSDYLLENKAESNIFEEYIQTKSEAFLIVLEGIFPPLLSENIDLGCHFINRLLEEKDENSNLLAIYAASFIVIKDTNYLIQELDAFDSLANEDKKYWLKLIPVYISLYQAMLKTDNQNIQLKERIKQKLDKIMTSNIEEKRVFLNFFTFEREFLSEFEDMIFFIASHSLDNDADALDSLNLIFFNYCRQNKEKIVIERLKEVYLENNHSDIVNQSFFNVFNSTMDSLSKKQEEVVPYTLYLLAKGNIKEFFFALGLLENCIDIKEIKKEYVKTKYDMDDFILMLEGIVLFCFEAKKVCLLALQIRCLIDSEASKCDKYLIENVADNYPSTFEEICKKYTGYEINDTIFKIREYLTQRKENASIGKGIADLRPTADRIIALNKETYNRNEEIKKMSEKESVFASLFPTQLMKYGVRSSYIQVQRDNQLKYVESDYAKFTIECELPQKYLQNPNLYAFERLDYIEKRK